MKSKSNNPAPLTVHDWIAKGLLPHGRRPNRKTMSPAHMRELVERYPGLYRYADDTHVSPCQPFALDGFTCGDGWTSIIDRLSAKLAEDPNLVVVQVKEKMGELRVYVVAPKGALKPDSVLAARLDDARTAARDESSRTCEICGEPGSLAERLRGWASVRCESCEWLDEIEEACQRLVDCAEGCIVSPPAGTPLDTARLHVQHIGEAASHQSRQSRTRLPGIDWERLDLLRQVATSMSAVEIWSFILDEVPTLEKALRGTKIEEALR